MNVKTTLGLLLLGALGAAGWFVYQKVQPAPTSSPTLEFLEARLTADDLMRIEAQAPGQKGYVLERTGKGEWSLPGGWPVRSVEADQLVDALTQMRSRYAPIALAK